MPFKDKEIEREYRRQYYLKHKEAINQQYRNYYDRNKDAVFQNQRKYNAENADKRRMYSRNTTIKKKLWNAIGHLCLIVDELK